MVLHKGICVIGERGQEVLKSRGKKKDRKWEKQGKCFVIEKTQRGMSCQGRRGGGLLGVLSIVRFQKISIPLPRRVF